MSSTLFLEAFGQLSRGVSLARINSEEEDLYSVFRARSELMSWSTTSTDPHAMLWEMNEAELTAGLDASRIGWVQVGLGVGVTQPSRALPAPYPGWAAFLERRGRAVEPAMVLPALAQCFDDALRRFGIVELSGLQVTASNLGPDTRSCAGHLVSGLNWFNTTPQARTDALLSLDSELLGGHTEAELTARLRQGNNGSFEFGPVVAVPEQNAIKVPIEAPLPSTSLAHSGLGISVTLPEWTASAAGWAFAIVIDAARTRVPDVGNFAARVTRVQ